MSKTKFIGSDEYRLRLAKAKVEANRQMISCGRKNWDEEDYNLFQSTLHKLMPVKEVQEF